MPSSSSYSYSKSRLPLSYSPRGHLRDYERLRLEHICVENYDRWVAYGRSKLANILFSNELARRLDSLSLPVTRNALHPGLVATNLLANANAFKNQGITPAEGTLTSIYLATSPEVAGQSGGYYQRLKPVLPGGDRTEISASLVEGQRLWTAACNELGLSEEL